MNEAAAFMLHEEEFLVDDCAAAVTSLEILLREAGNPDLCYVFSGEAG